MSSTWLRKVSRSIRAATIVVFSNKSVHLENGRFVVTMVLLFSLRSEMTLYERLEEYADEKGQTMTMALERILKQFFDKNDEEKKQSDG